MKFLFSLVFLFSCSPGAIKIVDDIIEGEAKVIENVINDSMANPINATMDCERPIILIRCMDF